MPDFNDAPIERPEEDLFGVNPFATAISRCILGLKKPVGSVVAINGPWGSGKSSVINLVRHHVAEFEANIEIINFQCWMYRSEDALAVGFFKELFAGLAPSLAGAEKAKSALAKLGAHVAGAGNLIGPIIGAVAGSAAGEIVKSASGALRGYIETDDSIDGLRQEVCEALANQSRRFLIVIDDIDRLAPEEALVVFRLVKTVGRLPNIVYLLAYDRETTEQAVTAKFPSEGSHYLEKIVQTGFELPEPDTGHLVGMLTSQLDQIFTDAEQPDSVRFGNLFHEAVSPEMHTPRDVLRLSNTLSITWGAVSTEADMTDFIALETLRLFRPSVYRAIRRNRHRVVGLGHDNHRNKDTQGQEYEAIFLAETPEVEKERLKRVLMGCFAPQCRFIT